MSSHIAVVVVGNDVMVGTGEVVVDGVGSYYVVVDGGNVVAAADADKGSTFAYMVPVHTFHRAGAPLVHKAHY